MDARIDIPATIILPLHSLRVRWQTKGEKELLQDFICFLQWIIGSGTTEK